MKRTDSQEHPILSRVEIDVEIRVQVATFYGHGADTGLATALACR